MGSWLGTGQPAGPTLVAATLTQPVRLEPQQPSTTYQFELNKKTSCTMNQAPIRPQRGLVPFSKDAKEPFFSSTWDEFDQMRNQMMEKNHGFWDKVDQDMKEFEKCVSQMEADMDNANAALRPSVPSWALPEDHKKNWPMIGNCTETRDCEVVKLETTESRWEVELDVAKFKPEDLKVAVVGDLVTIRHPDGANHWERHILEHKSIIHKAVHPAIRLRPRHTFIQSYRVRKPESYLSSKEVADWSLSQGHKIHLELPIIFC